MFVACVTGSRHAKFPSKVFKPMDEISMVFPIDILMHGGATGVDDFADKWARKKGIQPVVFPALWGYHGNAAGPVRNNNMSEFLSMIGYYLIVFPGGAGTADMKKNGLKIRGLTLIEVDDDGKWTARTNI